MNAIITGASRGLGKEIAWFLAEQKVNLVLIASNLELLQALKREITYKHQVEVLIFPCDLSNTLQTQLLCESIQSKIKSVDILVNNVGVFEMGTLETSPIEQLQKLLRINLEASYIIGNSFMSLFKKQKSGHIFNIGSIVSKIQKNDAAAYTISKIALNAYTQLLREELKDFNVKVTEIIPGSINTSSWDGINDVPKQDFIQTIDIANLIWTTFNGNPSINLDEIVIRPLNRNF